MKKRLLIIACVLSVTNSYGMFQQWRQKYGGTATEVCSMHICKAAASAEGAQREVLMAEAHNRCAESTGFEDEIIHLRMGLERAQKGNYPEVIKNLLEKKIFEHEYPRGTWKRFMEDGKQQLLVDGTIVLITGVVVGGVGLGYRLYSGNSSRS